MVFPVSNSSYMGESLEDHSLRLALDNSMRSYVKSKLTKQQKGLGGVVQEVKCLPSPEVNTNIA
jgi:hypothetical protein